MEKLTEWLSEKEMNWSELGRQCGLSVQWVPDYPNSCVPLQSQNCSDK